MKSNTIIKMLSVASVLVMVAACGEQKSSADAKDVIARYNGGEVTKQDVEEQMKELTGGNGADHNIDFNTLDASTKENIVKEIVARKIVSAEAKKMNLEKDPEVKKSVDAFTQQIVRREVVKRKAQESITEDKIKARYDELSKSIASQEEVHARHILVKSKKEADDIKAKLDAGESFEKLAAANSLDNGNKNEGGDLGYFVRGQMVKEFENVAFSLKKGQISDPVKTSFGWHIIKLEDRRPAQVAPYEKVKKRIEGELAQGATQEYITSIITNAKIEMVGDAAKPAEAPAAKDAAPKDKAAKKADPKQNKQK